MGDTTQLRGSLTAAAAEARRVGDSPLRADQLAAKVEEISASLSSPPLTEDTRARVAAALETALRCLRRDDDGREAARHLESAARLTEDRPRPPSPF